MNAIFSPDLVKVLNTINIQRAPLPKLTLARAAQHAQDVRRCVLNDMSWLPLSQRLSQPAKHARIKHMRRRDLETISLSEFSDERTKARFIDLITAICEETSWANEIGAPMEDMAHPVIDEIAADTAALFAWVSLCAAEVLDAYSPRMRGRMLYEVRRRAFTPVLAHDDYPFLRGAQAGDLMIVSTLSIAAMLLETDIARRNAVLKKLFRALDALIGAKYPLSPLEPRIKDACALSDFAFVTLRLSGGSVDWAPSVPDGLRLDEILFSHISEDYFFNPAGKSSRPEISGADLFRLGRFSGDREISALGASLHHQKPVPSFSATGRFLDWMHRESLNATFAIAPRPMHAATEDGRIMTARGGGFSASMTNGLQSAYPGVFSIFLDGSPVFVPDGADFSPEVAGQKRLLLPEKPTPADWSFEKERSIMGVDMMGIYPAGVGVRAHQRTIVLSRAENTLQLLDVMDLEHSAQVRFLFSTPFAPDKVSEGVRVGPALFCWEGAPVLEIARTGGAGAFKDGLYRLSLTYADVPPRAMFTFFFARA